eukprot:TRINITY_DN9010_c0_g1_i1.p1 TRINITY_DN9010_c0_g1~~TRINITY_DN9010_c0_g1_i1.p1  ORF type:complete len:156 (+),score=25.03 TRINITY_DN9010_c0_g1_i1:88-555(+)
MENLFSCGSGDSTSLKNKTIDIVSRLKLIYSFCEERCYCSKMIIGTKYEYLWKYDDDDRPVPVTARRYVTLLFDWIDSALVKEHSTSLLRDILRRVFRVYGHIYYHHWNVFEELGQTNVWQKGFLIYIKFVKQNKLVHVRDLEPLAPLIHKLENL